MDVPNDFNDGLSLSERPTYMQQHVLSRCTVTERPSWVRPSYNTCRDYQASGPYMQETTKNENIIPDRNNLDNDEVDLYRTMDSGSTGSSHGSDQPESNMNESMQNDDNDENKDVEFIEAHARQNQNGLERIIANNEFIEIIQTTQQWDDIDRVKSVVMPGARHKDMDDEGLTKEFLQNRIEHLEHGTLSNDLWIALIELVKTSFF
ncbi:hypothetical protein M5K25_025641 [Dendrobium thyrsiflorum]|uniref:Uncharacterized protein n=1 Tax=Dendrobium thyrsiflorum TaxID=117978 RepID=A0ABD0U4M2_DENTH